MQIVPAILTGKKDEFQRMVRLSEEFAETIQIDIMDGKFVESKSVSQEDIKGIECSKYAEAHLMVEEPLDWIDVFKSCGAKRIIIHYEIKAEKEPVIQNIRAAGLSAGLAVNPYTQIKDFRHLVDKVDTVLFMSVIPGFYGAKFIPEVLDKIKGFKKEFADKPIGIDGGVKIDNIDNIVSLGIDFICVGSSILKASDPAASYSEFTGHLGGK